MAARTGDRAAIGCALVVLLACAPTFAYDPERDAWLIAPAADEVRLGPREPFFFTRVQQTGSDLPPRLAAGQELSLLQQVGEGRQEAVKTLLDTGLNPNRSTALQAGTRALVEAVERGDAEMVRLLLEAGAHPDLGGQGLTPLGLAALRGHARIARLLLRAGAQVDLKGADGNTPLYNAALMGHTAVIRALLPHRPDFSLSGRGLPGYEGLNALGVAAYMGHTEALRTMLQAGADPDLLDRMGRPPLYYAVLRRHRGAVHALLEHGADPGAISVDDY